QEDRGAGRQGAGEGDALLLPAGELVGIASLEATEPDQLQHLAHALFPFGAPQATQPEADGPLHRQVREERAILEDEGGAAVLGRDESALVAHGPPSEHALARVRLLEPGDEAQQRRLPRAALPDQRQDLAVL